MQIRILLVEDVPQVAQYIRGLLNASQQVKLLDVLTDGRHVTEQVSQLRPDIVIVDALLQGKVRGLQVVEAIRKARLPVAQIVLTVPQNPVAVAPERGVDAVLSMPFSGYDFINLLQETYLAHQSSAPEALSRIVSVFAPKGGVGKTTIAFNLSVALGQSVGVRTVLVDGSLQFGDLRSLLKVPPDVPSILDLPTDRIQEADLEDVLWRDPSGIDILLAPPRVEMAEMVTSRDIDKVLSLLRRVYNVVVIDTPVSLQDTTLAFLDASDIVLNVVTYDLTTIRNTAAIAEAFAAIGYPPSKLQYVVNRSDSAGGLDLTAVAQALGGRVPEYSVVSDGRLVMEANNQGVPFVLASPGAKISVDVIEMATQLAGVEAPVAARA